MKSILQKVFSIKKEKDHRIINFFFLKIKIKRRYSKSTKMLKEHELFLKTIPMYISQESGGFRRLLRDKYFEKTGLLPNETPQTINQKIVYSMMFKNGNDPLKKKCCDKIAVRDYVAEKIGIQYLPAVLAMWEKAEDIRFDDLPDKFYLKLNDGQGRHILVKNDSSLDLDQMRHRVRTWFADDFAFRLFEFQYLDMKKYVYAEELLEMDNKYEYKIWCFHGKAEYIQVLSYERGHGKIGTKWLDVNWNEQNFHTSKYKIEGKIIKPKQIDDIVNLSEKLSADFDFVRVDWYILKNGDIKLGELTFSPTAGRIPFFPADADKTLGMLWNMEK